LLLSWEGQSWNKPKGKYFLRPFVVSGIFNQSYSIANLV
jgi:hypothetical protein